MIVIDLLWMVHKFLTSKSHTRHSSTASSSAFIGEAAKGTWGIYLMTFCLMSLVQANFLNSRLVDLWYLQLLRVAVMVHHFTGVLSPAIGQYGLGSFWRICYPFFYFLLGKFLSLIAEPCPIPVLVILVFFVLTIVLLTLSQEALG